MEPHNYEVVFNVAQEPYRGWLGAAFSLIVVAVGVGTLALGERTSTKIMGTFAALFASIVTVLMLMGSWQQYQRLQRDLREGHFSVVEGRVEDFQSDTKTENFHIGDHDFDILKPSITAAYNGGANLDRRCVRIFYTDRSEIIWLGIRRSGCVPVEALQPGTRDVHGGAVEPHIGLWDP